MRSIGGFPMVGVIHPVDHFIDVYPVDYVIGISDKVA